MLTSLLEALYQLLLLKAFSSQEENAPLSDVAASSRLSILVRVIRNFLLSTRVVIAQELKRSLNYFLHVARRAARAAKLELGHLTDPFRCFLKEVIKILAVIQAFPCSNNWFVTATLHVNR